MKRTLIFQTVNLIIKEKMVITLEGSKRNIDMMQSGIENKVAIQGWFLAKVIKHRTAQP